MFSLDKIERGFKLELFYLEIWQRCLKECQNISKDLKCIGKYKRENKCLSREEVLEVFMCPQDLRPEVIASSFPL